MSDPSDCASTSVSARISSDVTNASQSQPRGPRVAAGPAPLGRGGRDDASVACGWADGAEPVPAFDDAGAAPPQAVATAASRATRVGVERRRADRSDRAGLKAPDARTA